MKVEIWKDLPGYEGRYKVSSLGRVKGHRYDSNHIKKLSLSGTGYLSTGVNKDGKTINKEVHRLVAITFLPNPNNLPQVNHINCIKTDNRIENLEWCTSKENINHFYKMVNQSSGLGGLKRGGHTRGVKIINHKTGEIYNSAAEAGRKLGICDTTVLLRIKSKKLSELHSIAYFKKD